MSIWDERRFDEVCNRCDQLAAGVYASQPSAESRLPEMLSGHGLAVRLGSSLSTELVELYGPFRLDEADIEIDSVPWDISPSTRQEPYLNPSYGTGDAVPGTLLHSGEFSHAAVDLSIPGRGLGFTFARTYRSQTLGNGPLGPGWDHSYNVRLRPLPNGNVEIFDGRGRRETYLWQGNDAGEFVRFLSPPGRFEVLRRTTIGYSLVDARHNVHRFDRYGRLTSFSNSVQTSEDNGARLDFHYDATSRLVRVSGDERNLYLRYDAEGRLSELEDHSGRIFRYTYDAVGRLVDTTTPAVTTGEAKFPGGIVTSCSYAEPDAALVGYLNQRDDMTSIQQPRPAGTPAEDRVTLTYTDERVTGQTWGGDALSLTYNAETATTVVTDRRGHQRTYEHTETGHLKKLTDPQGHETSLAYAMLSLGQGDPPRTHGLVSRVTLPDDQVTETKYTVEVPPVSSPDPLAPIDVPSQWSLGNVSSVTRKPNSTDPDDLNGSEAEIKTTWRGYDIHSNRPQVVIDAAEHSVDLQRNAVGLPLTIETQFTSDFVSDLTALKQRVFDAFGQMLSSSLPIQGSGPDGSLTSPVEHRVEQTYNATPPFRGYLEEQKVMGQGLELITRYEHDARGNAISVTDPRGVTHERIYNELNWLVEERLASKISAIAEAPPSPIDQRIHYLYDVRGNLAEVRRGMGPIGSQDSSSTFVVYGPLDEVLTVRQQIKTPQGAVSEAVETMTYDANRNLTSSVGPEGEMTQLTYDSRNQVVRVDQLVAAGQTTHTTTAYNALGQPISTTDERGNLWTIEYDGYGRPAKQFDPLLNYQKTVYDARGDVAVKSFHQADGKELTQTMVERDSGGRAVKTTETLSAEDGSTETRSMVVELDEASKPRRYLDANAKEFLIGYDEARRPIRFHSVDDGQTVDRTLDAQGNVKTLLQTGPTGSFEQTSTYDAMGRPLSVDPGVDNIVHFTYDRRGNRLTATAPGDASSQWTYDSLDRVVSEVRPEGVAVGYGYDLSSRPITYTDAKNQTTRWTYNKKSELTGIEYADETEETYGYDPSSNLILTTRPDGSEIAAAYDAAHRLSTRQVTPAAGLGGVLNESFVPDALGRIKEATHGGVTTAWTYDALSRIKTETQGSKTVAYTYDDQGNVTELGYPSGMALERTHTPQNLLQAVGEAGTGTFEPWASYQERIPGLVEGRTIGDVVGTMAYDAAMRPLTGRYTKSGDRIVFGEQLSWTPRNQLASRQRLDLNGWSEAFTYDLHDRLTGMERQSSDGEVSSVSPTGGNASWAFTYDNVHNLLSREEQQLCSIERTEMPVDDSGRHRPASVGGKTLVWNDNGELIQKGDQYFTYDYRGRLVRIEQEADGQLTELVSYTYDALNRRVEQHFPNRTIRTVWDGWQPIEEYEIVDSGEGDLMTRRIYGRGIDEVVRLENRLSSDNAELQAFLPFYDSSGNLALMTSFLGGAVERYEYSPYGDRHAWSDTDRPAIEQVRIADGDVVIEMSEAVDFGVLGQALADSTLMLQNVTQDEDVAIEIRAAVTTGRQAYRRIVLGVDEGSRPAVGDSVRLTLPHTGVVDYFGNSMDQTNIGNFAWPAGDHVFTDTVPPKVASVCTTAEGRLEIQFSEPVNLATANASIDVNNQGVTWTVAEAGYSLVSNVTLSAGSHELEISTDLLDLDDLPLAAGFEESFVLADGNFAQTVYTDEQAATGGSVLSNALGFQGLHHDAVSGLIYVRNRYYDPEMGRFITPDPMGFVDGPNVYQFAVGNPVNYRDPLGLFALGLGQCGTTVGEAWQECMVDSRNRLEEFNKSTHGQYINGTIMGTVESPVALGKAVYQVVRYPIQSAKSLAYFVTHPFEVAAEGIVDFQMASPFDRGHTIGGALGDLAMAGAVGKAIQASRTAKRLDLDIDSSSEIDQGRTSLGPRSTHTGRRPSGRPTGMIGDIRLDLYHPGAGSYVPPNPFITINRRSIRALSRVETKYLDLATTWRQTLSSTVYHEFFHKAVAPLSRLGRPFGVDDLYRSSRRFRMSEEYLASMYGQLRGSMRAGRSGTQTLQDLRNRHRYWKEFDWEAYIDPP